MRLGVMVVLVLVLVLRGGVIGLRDDLDRVRVWRRDDGVRVLRLRGGSGGARDGDACRGMRAG